MSCSFYNYSQKRRLANGEVKIYNYQRKYIKKGCKFDDIKIKYNDIIKDTKLKPMEKVEKIMNNLTNDEKKMFNKNQIINFVYRIRN